MWVTRIQNSHWKYDISLSFSLWLSAFLVSFLPLLALNKSYISHGKTFRTILGSWLNLACLFLSRISVGSFWHQPSHAYTVIIPLSYYFLYGFKTMDISIIASRRSSTWSGNNFPSHPAGRCRWDSFRCPWKPKTFWERGHHREHW